MSEYISTADPVNVPFSDDDESVRDDDLILDDDPSASPAERVTRAKKKSERVARLLAEGKQSKEEAAALRAEMAELKANQARLEGFVAAQRQPAPQGDPYQSRLDAIRARQAEAHRQLQAEVKAGTYTPERDAHYTRIAAEIEDAKSEVIAERTLARIAPAQRQEQAQQVWAHKYPEVYNNPKAFQYAQATYQRRVARGEKVETEQIDEIMQETMTDLRLGGKGKPTAAEKARLSGQSSGGSSGGGGGPGVAMTPALRRMATAMFSGEMGPKGQPLTEDEAIQKWTNTVGKELRKQKVL